MKLISNFKDYYDFLISKYGIDEKCIYERVCSTEHNDSKWYKSGVYNPNFNLEIYKPFRINFCGKTYFGHYYNGKIYYGLDAEFIPKSFKTDWGRMSRDIVSEPKDTDINEINKCPVMIGKDIKNPKLSDFQFGKVMPAEEAFLQISNFIMREPLIINKQSDKEKIVAHGFDLKSSFRKV